MEVLVLVSVKRFVGSRFPSIVNFLRLNLRYSKTFYGVPIESFERATTIWKKLFSDYGYGRTCETNSCVNAAGDPIPWYTYPAIEFLSALSFAGKSVWEYGCGNSTLWWAVRADVVQGVESEPGWHSLVSKRLPGNCRIDLIPTNRRAYIDSVRTGVSGFDVIVVDGLAADLYRFECCVAGAGLLKTGGMIILDNSDWLPRSCEWLVQNGFTQIDFNGFSPINDHAGRTSIFFRDRLAFERLPNRPTIAGVVQNWEGAVPSSIPGQMKYAEQK